jgi:hypothetical protein
MPDEMVMMAMRFGFTHCEVRKSVAETGSSLVEKDPGIMRMSNCGAFAKEFWIQRQLDCSMDRIEADER